MKISVGDGFSLEGEQFQFYRQIYTPASPILCIKKSGISFSIMQKYKGKDFGCRKYLGERF